MKRIALTLATLAMSAGAAFAATPAPAASAPATAATTPKAMTPHHPHHAMQAASRSSDHTAQRMTSALNLLEAKGYGSFDNFKSDGKNFTATVTRNGHEMSVRVDPDRGQVTVQS
jgi:hypothetical protein